MGRTSDTRARVRALAVVWTREGRELTPTLVREALGGGSSTTIVDELRRFREDALAQAILDPGTAAADEGMTHSGAEAPAQAPAPTSNCAGEPGEQPVGLIEAAALKASVDALTAELSKAMARFDAMQKRMLREIDEARETARYWKDVADKAQAENRSQLESYRNSMYREMERANQLQGRIQQLQGSPIAQ